MDVDRFSRWECYMIVNQFKKNAHVGYEEQFEGGEMIALKSPNFCKQKF